VFNGLTHDSYVVEYQRKPECMSHDTYALVEERPWSVRTMSLGELLDDVRKDSFPDAVIDLDRDIATTASCSCGARRDLYLPVHKLKEAMLVCDGCGQLMQFEMTHTIDGSEDFLGRKAIEVGIPLLHIVGARDGARVRYYEFTGDADEVFADLERKGRS
jgi:adenylyltransferase/sulfurtransferase